MGDRVKIECSGPLPGGVYCSAGLFQSLFETNPIPMWIYEADTSRFVAVNDAACALYGYERADLLQKRVSDVQLEDVRKEVGEGEADVDAEHWPRQYRTQIRADGERIRVLIFAQNITYRDRECVVEWSVDFADIEQSSIELRRTQIFLDAIVESIPSMVFVKDAHDGRFVLLNKAGEQLLHIDRRDLIGKTDFDLFDYEEAARFRTADKAVVAYGKLVTIDNEPLSTPGGMRSLRTQKVAVPDINGCPRYLLGISEDVTEKLKMEERNRHLALHDVLTNLPNRLMFQDMLDRELADAAGNSDDCALLLVDLDRFKAVNDHLGHHAGDELLRQVARCMQALRMDQDVVARLGGDEFGIIHRSATAETAVALARALIESLSRPFRIDGNRVSISCSIGISLKSRHGTNADALMKRADLALYAAKATGRGDYAWFEMGMEEQADRQRMLRDELSVALEKRQLHLEYQPVVSMATGRVVCCEALLRWRHPTRGLISSAEFIPVAESSGLIEPIGRWVLDQACCEAAGWPSDIRIAVNLSPRQFSGSDLPAYVGSVLRRTGLAAERLELEITESVFLTDSEENVRILNELKRLGVNIALDDFGTGYSSLAYLRRVAFDKLKIDQSFVKDLASSNDNLAIVRAVIGLGKSFGATVTAEGVESEEQYECLDREGCDEVQGYLICRPVPAATVTGMFQGVRYIITRPRQTREWRARD